MHEDNGRTDLPSEQMECGESCLPLSHLSVVLSPDVELLKTSNLKESEGSLSLGLH